MSPAKKNDFADAKRALTARRAELRALMDSGDEEGRAADFDQQRVGRLSRMDAMQVQAMAEETARRRATELARIEAALRRIEDGEYGHCTACDQPISSKRLETDPATPLCIACAGRAG